MSLQLRADYHTQIKNEVCVIFDRHTEGHPTAISDIYQIVIDLQRIPEKFDRIICRDLDGYFGEVVVKQGNFAKFIPIGLKDTDLAVQAVRWIARPSAESTFIGKLVGFFQRKAKPCR